MSGIIVSKYGGSSITCKEDVERIRMITEMDERKIIVISAPGKKDAKGEKVTDILIKLAETNDMSLIPKIMERYINIYKDYNTKNLDSIQDDLILRTKSILPDNARMDLIKAFGEEMNARLLAQALNAEYVDPREILSVSGDFGNAKVLDDSDSMIKKLRSKNGVVVVPGFYGYTRNGYIATFNRGGSDLTGALLAASLDAKCYENFTDKDGVFSADPKIVKNPNKIDELTYTEMLDLAYIGFDIFQAEAMEPVERRRIPVHIRNTFKFPMKGTHVVYDRISDPKKPVVGVAYKKGFCSFNIKKTGMNDEAGITYEILGRFVKRGNKKERLSIEFITTGIHNIAVILREEQLKYTGAVNDITQSLYSLLGEHASIKFQEHMGAVAVAGKGLRGRCGIAADIQLTIADTGVNTKFISQGPEERCIIYGVGIADGRKVVNAIYNKYLK